jgi:glycosyltransferase involved in cell wall biosynthesis
MESSMYKNKAVCAIVPAYNEEQRIQQVIETMPGYVDKIVVVDDCSTDSTAEKVRSLAETLKDKLILISHEKNQGVGGAIATGYKWARDNKMDVACVMAGDAQMSPEDLPALLEPVVSGEVDYTKGNRFFSGDAWRTIPRFRYFGNAALSLLTKFASGYWHVADSQTGYTAINLKMLNLIDWDKTYKRYGCPNDYLVRLNVYNARVRDIAISPIYNAGARSGIKYWRFIPTVSWLLFKLFLWRMVQKYIIRDFHPLVFFYVSGFICGLTSLLLFCRLVVLWITTGHVPEITALTLGFFTVVSMQFTLFAMWFDMEKSRDLK